MQNEDYSLLSQFYYIKKAFNNFFSHKCETPTNNQLIEVRGPGVLNRRKIWESGSIGPNRRRRMGSVSGGPKRLGDFH